MAQLRELKKRQTRTTISHVATRMFMERGFERTTIAEIAQAAGVSKMTVTNYFPRKEDLFFDAYDEVVNGPSRTVAGRAEGESALTALRRAYLDGIERRDPLYGNYGPDFVRLIDESPALQARLREIYDQQEEALAATLAEEAGEGASWLEIRLAAAQLAGVQRVLFNEAHRRLLAGDSEEEFYRGLAEAARRAYAMLEPVLGGYAVR
ncbi:MULTISPECIES: TetR/AcrR family transcriptional regulator [Streptomycetaceae]|uniref:Putative transcriptional regulator, TetR family n=1 Tax=Streptantibioticus cattleyicolor (strain ATCC 35852 / DSM 46488 / JCM 4925 / NBRC 14057 / NRRL 8057) TaxID=1003195 RepID=F8K0Q2_STREN|nr:MULTISPECIES: TetR family transcriptional regulator [Streptomycetaceae]AEW94739.1 putative transcriptional regulator, TetR family [Streptantibioticus cattleyicolor NRRL 8057 = DSM 46488]MYS59368.1 TetR family transcriptional regulator [Streptomyces sp. SID5468]CCB75094.1 Transcriptional regulator, TetR family [Streptantibioticus cattleyicolor NRRL 8057 = DSM 46488]